MLWVTSLIFRELCWGPQVAYHLRAWYRGSIRTTMLQYLFFVLIHVSLSPIELNAIQVVGPQVQ